MKFPRASGILLHPTSLPGPFGIGDLGEEAFRFVDFLRDAGQTYWQVLPLSPTGYGDSPYQGLSAFAGNPMLISPEKHIEVGLLSAGDIADRHAFPSERVEYGEVIPYKTELLTRAFTNFQAGASAVTRDKFAHFCSKNAFWLDDFALYMAIKVARDLKPWVDWETPIVKREADVLRDLGQEYSAEVESHKFRQWQFFEQWSELKAYANQQGIRLIGDIPIFVAMDSADVWANPELFQFDESLRPLAVSGVPPDGFSATGQLWGHPLYRWDVMEEGGYAWWIHRFRVALRQVDVVRVDHFRGFYNYWEVPVDAETAIEGRWLNGPGAKFLQAVRDSLDEVPIIAEDLGDFDTPSRVGVDALLAEFGYPGMKVLQFAFSTDTEDPFLPHNFTRDWVVYTGTHDNDTVVGWFQDSSSQGERDFARKYIGTDGSDIAWDFIRLAWASVAHTAMTNAQDLLNLDQSARMNLPSTMGAPNWGWRLEKDALTPEIANRLRTMTAIYGRLRSPSIEETG
jgi:4-alpha-glucanotransferase